MMVKQSEGYIWVNSELGLGTTFQIHLPRVALAAEKTAEPQKVVHGARGTETILLVEDAEALRELARVLLETAGYKIVWLFFDGGSQLVDVAADFLSQARIAICRPSVQPFQGSQLLAAGAVAVIAR